VANLGAFLVGAEIIPAWTVDGVSFISPIRILSELGRDLALADTGNPAMQDMRNFSRSILGCR
jgi:hypothetical protein